MAHTHNNYTPNLSGKILSAAHTQDKDASLWSGKPNQSLLTSFKPDVPVKQECLARQAKTTNKDVTT